MYYDGTKLLSLKDINGETPEIYMCTTNRTGGKTTYFGRLCVNRFLDGKGKFMLIYRFDYELHDISGKFFKDLKTLFFPEYTMTEKAKAKGMYVELYLNDKSCGYAVALNKADGIKKLSHFFSDVHRMLFDEFQSETNHYCSDEVNKLYSIHTSVARGNGEQVRYVPLYMIANPITIINPYYVTMGISSRITEKVKFLKGDGWVLEQGYVKSASDAQKLSGFNRAFSASRYSSYASEAVYLNDNKTFIEKPSGTDGRYICTIKYNGKNYGIREFAEMGIIYCDSRADLTFPIRLSVTTEDHEVNYVMLKQYDYLIQRFRFFFEKGCFRFKDLLCKEAILKAISF